MKEVAIRRYSVDKDADRERSEALVNTMLRAGWEMRRAEFASGDTWTELLVLFEREDMRADSDAELARATLGER